MRAATSCSLSIARLIWGLHVAASLLGSHGVVLPADADAAAEKEEAAGGGQEV